MVPGYLYPYPVHPARPELGIDWSKLIKKGAKGAVKYAGLDMSKIKEDIKADIRAEIKAGMIKMFLAGMAATIIGNFIFSRFSK